MRYALLSSLLLSASVALSAPAPFIRPDRSTDYARLQGTWTCEAGSCWGEGGWIPLGLRDLSDLVIRGDRIVWSADNVEGFALHTKMTPRGIDFVSPLVGQVLGVYTLKDDT